MIGRNALRVPGGAGVGASALPSNQPRLEQLVHQYMCRELVAALVPARVVPEDERRLLGCLEGRKEIQDRITDLRAGLLEESEVLEPVGLRDVVIGLLPVIRCFRGVPVLESRIDGQHEARMHPLRFRGDRIDVLQRLREVGSGGER